MLSTIVTGSTNEEEEAIDEEKRETGEERHDALSLSTVVGAQE